MYCKSIILYHNDICFAVTSRVIDNFGTVDNPRPPLCVYSTNSNDVVLHCGIPLEGINPPTTVYIHRAARTIGQEGIVIYISSY